MPYPRSPEFDDILAVGMHGQTCEERDHLWAAFQEAAETYSIILPSFRARLHDELNEHGPAMQEATRQVDATRDAYLEHVGTHQCARTQIAANGSPRHKKTPVIAVRNGSTGALLADIIMSVPSRNAKKQAKTPPRARKSDRSLSSRTLRWPERRSRCSMEVRHILAERLETARERLDRAWQKFEAQSVQDFPSSANLREFREVCAAYRLASADFRVAFNAHHEFQMNGRIPADLLYTFLPPTAVGRESLRR